VATRQDIRDRPGACIGVCTGRPLVIESGQGEGRTLQGIFGKGTGRFRRSLVLGSLLVPSTGVSNLFKHQVFYWRCIHLPFDGVLFLSGRLYMLSQDSFSTLRNFVRGGMIKSQKK
jgi:hypothetical protein